MKAILDLDGFTKIVELEEATIFHVERIHMDDQVLDVPFVRLARDDIDGEETYVYKMVEPKKDGYQK